MAITCIKRQLCFLALLLFPILGMAAAWQIIPDKSVINFTATQNNAPVTGSFKTFTGEIQFDKDQLATSHINITVDTGSIATPYGQVSDLLKTADWLNVKAFPQAVFKSDSITKIGDNLYQAKGMLTLLDQTNPIAVNFILAKYTATEASVEGTTLLKRTAFAVGKHDWASVAEIKDEVKIDFILTAIKK